MSIVRVRSTEVKDRGALALSGEQSEDLLQPSANLFQLLVAGLGGDYEGKRDLVLGGLQLQLEMLAGTGDGEALLIK